MMKTIKILNINRILILKNFSKYTIKLKDSKIILWQIIFQFKTKECINIQILKNIKLKSSQLFLQINL